jgi:methionyl-tRNA synthetase
MSYYVTTPIYYVNDTPHIGHAYTTIAADILVRHQRQRGQDTFFLTGVDEHADKVARVAAQKGLAPREYTDSIVGAWQDLPRRLNASVDFFIRTTDEGHKRFVQDFLQRIYDSGDVYQDVYAGWYCVGCEEFKAEDELVGGNCPIHDRPAEWLEEKNWFFRLSAYEERLLRLYDERPDFVLPDFRANEARSFIAGGLRDFSISRATQTWGIPIPWDPDQVAYVWADALVNYLSALTYARDGDDLRPVFWPATRHLIGKDILRFHCVFWPALLLSAGYEPPQQIFAHGFLLLEGRKISKSLGNLVSALELVDVYGPDAVRFWCARAVSFGQDGQASVEDIRERYERELGNDLGNLLSRTTAMIARYREGRLPIAAGSASPVAGALEPLGRDVAERLDRYDLTGALERIWEVVRFLNRHVETQAPWQLAKDDSRAQELDETLHDLAEGLRAVAIALASYLPQTAERIL